MRKKLIYTWANYWTILSCEPTPPHPRFGNPPTRCENPKIDPEFLTSNLEKPIITIRLDHRSFMIRFKTEWHGVVSRVGW